MSIPINIDIIKAYLNNYEVDDIVYNGESINSLVVNRRELFKNPFTYTLLEDGTWSVSAGTWGWDIPRDVVIPSTFKGIPVTRIADSAFDLCDMTSLTIPDSVTSIGEGAFKSCRYLTNVSLPNSITSIGKETFRYCRALRNINIPNSVTSIGEYAFYECECLTNIEIPDSVISIGKDAFTLCKSLTQVTLGNSLQTIGKYAFDNCINLQNIILPESLTCIDSLAFAHCDSFTHIKIPASVSTVGANAFYDIKGLTIYCDLISRPSGWADSWNAASSSSQTIHWIGKFSFILNSDDTYSVMKKDDSIANTITIPNTYLGKVVTEIADSGFALCKGITKVVIPDSITKVNNYAFAGCEALTSISIPTNVTYIGSSVFNGCSNLTTMTLPFVGASKTATGSTAVLGYIFGTSSYTGGVQTSQLYTLSGSSTRYYIPEKLKTITISGGEIPLGAFYNCSNLTKVTIPNSATTIGEYAFYNCTGITSMTIPNNVEQIASFAFDYCSALASINIPSSVTSIGYRAFRYCSSLTSITIPSSVTSIGIGAFRLCDKLTSVDLEHNVWAINNVAHVIDDSTAAQALKEDFTDYVWTKYDTSETVPPVITSITKSGKSTLTITIRNDNPVGLTPKGAITYTASSLSNNAVVGFQNFTVVPANGTITLAYSLTDREAVEIAFTSAKIDYYFGEAPTAIGQTCYVDSTGNWGIMVEYAPENVRVNMNGYNEECHFYKVSAYNPNSFTVTLYVTLFDQYGVAYGTSTNVINPQTSSAFEIATGVSFYGWSYDMYFTADGYARSNTVSGNIIL